MVGQHAAAAAPVVPVLGLSGRCVAPGGCGHGRCHDCTVRRIAVCAAVEPALLPNLAAIALDRDLAPEQVLFDEGDRAESVFVVTAGMLKLYKVLADGRRQIVGFMVPGDFLGLAFGRLYLYSAEAVTPVGVCSFRRARFLSFLDDCPSLEKEVLLRTSTELAAAQEQMLLLGRKSAVERVASFILSMAHRRRLAAGEPVELPMSRADIADYLGLTVETVSRTLSSLRRQAMIEFVDRHLVAIPRPGRLEQVAGA